MLWWYNMCSCGKRAPVKSSKILIVHLWKINPVPEMQLHQVSAVHNTVTGLIVPVHFFCATFWRQFCVQNMYKYICPPSDPPPPSPRNDRDPGEKKSQHFTFYQLALHTK